jgi:deoxyribodipyrimidine photo-lyase
MMQRILWWLRRDTCTVSVRELARQAPDATVSKGRQGNGAQVWMDEPVWRELFNQVLYHFPHAARRSFRDRYANLRWDQDAEAFEAWRTGQTGYPPVDAGMRQLNATGWTHNRARMVTALHIHTPWRMPDWSGEKQE